MNHLSPPISVFQIAVWDGGDIGNFAGGIFLDDGENLKRSDFDHSNLFQSKKHHSVNAEHQLKSKLT